MGQIMADLRKEWFAVNKYAFYNTGTDILVPILLNRKGSW